MSQESEQAQEAWTKYISKLGGAKFSAGLTLATYKAALKAEIEKRIANCNGPMQVSSIAHSVWTRKEKQLLGEFLSLLDTVTPI